MEQFKKFMQSDFDELITDKVEDVEVIPTGSYSLDISIGPGGIPKGKFSLVYGPESSAKTTLSLGICREALKQGDSVLFIDVENQLDLKYSKDIIGASFDENKFILVQPELAEDAFKIAERGIESGEFGLVVMDSIAALAPEKEKKDDFEDANVGLISRMLGKFFRRQAYPVRKNNVAVLFTNQVRDTIGSYVSTYSVPGGHALKHYCSLIVMLSKGVKIEVKKNIIGLNVKFSVKKNKIGGIPFAGFTIPVMFGMGVDSYLDLLTFASQLDIISRRGSFYYYGDAKLGQGSFDASKTLMENKEILDEILKECYNMVNPELAMRKENEE